QNKSIINMIITTTSTTFPIKPAPPRKTQNFTKNPKTTNSKKISLILQSSSKESSLTISRSKLN
ncbi:hypothetical protein AAHH79_36675, partial [Burkholderia pseudomallei]